MFEAPATHYVREGDLALAYQVLGDGPMDLFFVTGGQFPIDLVWEQPRTARFLQRLASFSRLLGVPLGRRAGRCRRLRSGRTTCVL